MKKTSGKFTSPRLTYKQFNLYHRSWNKILEYTSSHWKYRRRSLLYQEPQLSELADNNDGIYDKAFVTKIHRLDLAWRKSSDNLEGSPGKRILFMYTVGRS